MKLSEAIAKLERENEMLREELAEPRRSLWTWGNSAMTTHYDETSREHVFVLRVPLNYIQDAPRATKTRVFRELGTIDTHVPLIPPGWRKWGRRF